jgi:hypothetical protein
MLALVLVVTDHGRRDPPSGHGRTPPGQPAVVNQNAGTPVSRFPPASRFSLTTPVTRAARGFAAGYLTLIYRGGRLRRVPHASAGLRAQLARNTARVPPAERGRHARVIALRVSFLTPNRARVTASIDDGRIAPWPLPMSLQRTPGGAWEVTALGD